MLLIIGTYRKRAYIERALDSLALLSGVTKWIAVDDSGDRNHVEWLRTEGHFDQVVDVGGRGYNTAMQAVCRAAGDGPFMFWEEDFTLLEPVDLAAMAATLAAHPELAQLALLRDAHFPIEHEHGGVLEGLVARLDQDAVDLQREPYGWSQRGTFTCNPAIWRAGIAAGGWPRGRWSEDRMRDHLIRAGYRFGFMEGVKVSHDGERSGHGY